MISSVFFAEISAKTALFMRRKHKNLKLTQFCFREKIMRYFENKGDIYNCT